MRKQKELKRTSDKLYASLKQRSTTRQLQEIMLSGDVELMFPDSKHEEHVQQDDKTVLWQNIIALSMTALITLAVIIGIVIMGPRLTMLQTFLFTSVTAVPLYAMSIFLSYSTKMITGSLGVMHKISVGLAFTVLGGLLTGTVIGALTGF